MISKEINKVLQGRKDLELYYTKLKNEFNNIEHMDYQEYIRRSNQFEEYIKRFNEIKNIKESYDDLVYYIDFDKDVNFEKIYYKINELYIQKKKYITLFNSATKLYEEELNNLDNIISKLLTIQKTQVNILNFKEISNTFYDIQNNLNKINNLKKKYDKNKFFSSLITIVNLTYEQFLSGLKDEISKFDSSIHSRIIKRCYKLLN